MGQSAGSWQLPFAWLLLGGATVAASYAMGPAAWRAAEVGEVAVRRPVFAS
jgi:hypothetical protein